MTIKDVVFNNVPNKKQGTKIGTMLTQSNIGVSQEVADYIASEEFYALVSALDIDWAGIQVAENVTINDTADLINWIKTLPAQGGQGEAGPQGAKGDQGEQGPQGVAGQVGETGPQGAKGDQGDQGPQGVAGQVGETGPQGAKGETGDQGPQGAAGADGADGAKGEAGADGKSAYEIYKATVNEQPAIYSFESFNNAAKEVKYGEGKVKVIEMRAGGATVEVIENSTDQSFVGQQFNVATGLGTDAPVQLHTLANEPVDIWVTVELVSEAVVALTEGEWLASLKGPQGATGTFDTSDLFGYATEQFVTNKIAEVVGAAPEALDTLKEIADRLGNDNDAIGALTATVAGKADAANVYTKQEVDGLIAEVETIQGEQGPQGATGAAGADGEQGPQGEAGAAGATGETGPQGAKGDQGDQGPQGVTGATGETGPQGAKGETGDQGPQGVTGATGETGPQGAKGETGDQGPQGAAGAAGEQGPQGAKGETGDQGPQGAAGAAGEQGPQGATGSFDASALADYVTKEELGTFGTESEYNTFDYIYDEASWNDSFANGVLKKYYTKYPDEDLWNPTAHRAANFNDKAYEASIYNDAAGTDLVKDAQYKAAWASANAQKITNAADTNEVYYLAMFYSIDDTVYELFTDAALTTSANLFVKMTAVSFPGCTQCWEGAVQAPGAKFPWICPNFEDDANVMIKFQYEGKDDVTPWNFSVFGKGPGHKEWGIASVATEFGDDSLAIAANGGQDAFDIAKFKVIAVSANADIPAAIKAYIDTEIAKLKA